MAVTKTLKDRVKGKKTKNPDLDTLVAETKKNREALMASLQKEFGKENVKWLNDSSVQDVAVIPTGSLALDAATTVGGVPRGRIIEIFGPPQGGKSSLALHMVAEAQRMGLLAAYIDVEHAVDKKYAAALGVDMSPGSLMFSQPDSGEKALNMAIAMTESKQVGIIVIDSVANLVPQAELDGDMEDNQMMAQPKMLTKGLRKLTGPASRTGTTIVFINQLRDAIGATAYMPKDKTTGGRALPFYASMRFNVKQADKLKDDQGKIIGHYCKIVVVKNKVGCPFGEAVIMFYNGRGFDRAADVLSAAVSAGIVTQSGATYAWGDVELGYGVATVIDKLREDKGLLEDLRSSVIGTMKHAAPVMTEEAEEETDD